MFALVLTMVFVFFLGKHSQAQVDTTAKKDTTVTPKDTTVTSAAATTQTTQSAPAEKPKGRSTFIIYAGQHP